MLESIQIQLVLYQGTDDISIIVHTFPRPNSSYVIIQAGPELCQTSIQLVHVLSPHRNNALGLLAHPMDTTQSQLPAVAALISHEGYQPGWILLQTTSSDQSGKTFQYFNVLR